MRVAHFIKLGTGTRNKGQQHVGHVSSLHCLPSRWHSQTFLAAPTPGFVPTSSRGALGTLSLVMQDKAIRKQRGLVQEKLCSREMGARLFQPRKWERPAVPLPLIARLVDQTLATN